MLLLICYITQKIIIYKLIAKKDQEHKGKKKILQIIKEYTFEVYTFILFQSSYYIKIAFQN